MATQNAERVAGDATESAVGEPDRGPARGGPESVATRNESVATQNAEQVTGVSDSVTDPRGQSQKQHSSREQHGSEDREQHGSENRPSNRQTQDAARPAHLDIQQAASDAAHINLRASISSFLELDATDDVLDEEKSPHLVAEFMSSWMALAMLAIGVWCTMALGYTVAIADQAGHHEFIWPFPATDSNECQDKLQSYRSDGGGKSEATAAIETVVASAPIWLRNALLTAVITKILAKASGFGSENSATPTVRQSSTELDGRPEPDAIADEMLSSLLARESFAGHAGEVAAIFRRREEQHMMELEAAKSVGKTSGMGGLLRILLTGHGLKPVPRVAAGWQAIADDSTPQSSWTEAREALGLSVQQAIAVSCAKLLLWHWSQPVAYLIVFRTYFCVISPFQKEFGMVVAAREMLYLATTIGGMLACPCYLLLDISTVWAEAETKLMACGHIAMYILTPHNYVALCLTARFSERGSPRYPRYRKAMAVLCIFSSMLGLKCVTLTQISVPTTILVSIELVSLGMFISMMVSQNLYWTSKHRHKIEDRTIQATTGGAQGTWYRVSDGGQVAFRYSPEMDNRSGVTAVPGEMIFAPPLESFTGEDAIEAVDGWICTEMSMWLPLSLLIHVPENVPVAVQERARTYHRLSVKQQYQRLYWYHMKRLYQAHLREQELQRQHEEKGPLASIFLSLALVQILADFCSCFALASLLQQANELEQANEHSQQTQFQFQAPKAMTWGYSITAFGFLLLFGPVSVVASYKEAVALHELTILGFDSVRTLRERAGGIVRRVGAACFGFGMFLGMIYMFVGAIYLVRGNDVFCTGYTKFYTRRDANQWESFCGEHAQPEPLGKCSAGACLCFEGYTGTQCQCDQWHEPGTSDNPKHQVPSRNDNSADLFCICSSPRDSIESIAGCPELIQGRFPDDTGKKYAGNIEKLSDLTTLTALVLHNEGVYGDISHLLTLTSLVRLDLQGTSVTGDINELKQLPQLTNLDLSGTRVTWADGTNGTSVAHVA
eukprot:SAG22_NODE_1570_length_4095_cov_8.591842_1_plen_1009_part_10